jgi:hypothetical protein
MEPTVKARRKRSDFTHTADCEPVLHGWSPNIRRWVAAQTTPALAAEHWTAAVLQQPGGPARMPLEAIKAVTIGNLAQVLDHRVTRSLDRSVHVVRFLPGGELRFVYDHQGRLIELATVGLSSRVSDDGTVTFNPPPDSLDHRPARGTAPLQWGCDGKHPVLDHSDQLRQRADRFGLECAMQEWRGWDEPYTFRCASAGHEFPLTARQLSTKTIACTACRGLESLARLRQRTEREGVRCLSTEWTGEAGPYLFECQQGHQWQRSAGPSIPRCPHCGFQAGALARRDPNGLARLRQAAEARGGACLSEAYTTSAARYRFRCAEGHEWETRGRMILDGAWCRSCASAQRRLEHQPPDQGLARLQAAAHAKGGACLDTVYRGLNEKHRFRCVHGHEWLTLGAVVLHGGWCRRCAAAERGARLRREDGLRQLKALAAERGGQCLSTEYKGIDHPVRLRCAQGHEWEVKAASPLRGKWCRFCAADANRLSIADAHAAAAERGGQCLSATYVDAKTRLEWMCHRGHTWLANLNNVRTGHWCPQCARVAQISDRHSKARMKYEPVD